MRHKKLGKKSCMVKEERERKGFVKGLLILLFPFTFSLSAIHAKETITTTGGNALGNGGIISYSIREIVYTINTGTNGSVAQGVQQPYEISVVTEIEEAISMNLVCFAFTNPAIDYVKLKVEKNKTEDLTYQLYDVNGKLLENKKIEIRT